MNKKTTRIIAIVLILLMALALIPIAASAEGEVIWTYYPGVDENGIPTGTPVMQTYGVGVAFNLPPASTFTKANHTLVSWHRVSDDIEFPAGSAVETGSGVDSILYAVWQENPKVTVSFNSNGGGGTMDPVTDYVGATVSIFNQFSAPEGSSFIGWATSADGSVVYGPSQTSLELSEALGTSLVLYAKWQPTVRYAILHFQPGTGGTGTMLDVTNAECGKPYTLPGNGFTPNTNMLFAGWKIGTDETVYPANYGYTIPADATELTLTAQWISDTVTVTFNDGTANVASQNMSRTAASALTAYSSMSGVTVPDSKVFIGWSRTSGAAVADFTDGESVRWDGAEGAKNYAAGGNITLYAVWRDAFNATISFAKGSSAVSTDTTFVAGDIVTALVNVVSPVPRPATLYYQWNNSNGDVVASGVLPADGKAQYSVKPENLGKLLGFRVSETNDFTQFKSGQVTIKAAAAETVTLTFTLTRQDTDKVFVNGTELNYAAPTATVNKGAAVTVTLSPGSDRSVKSVKKGTTAVTPSNSFTDWTFDANTAIEIEFAANSAGTTKTAEVTDSTVPSAATSAFASLMSTMPRSRGMLKDVVACWDHDPTNPLDQSEIPAAGLSFTLPYPTGSDVNSTVRANMSGYYKVRVWHWTGTAYEEVPAANVKPQKAFNDGIQVTYNKFSPIGATLEPNALDGTVKLSTGGKEITGTIAFIDAEITAAYSKTAVGTLSYEWQISSDNGTSWSHLTTGAKYTPKSADKGKLLRVNVTSTFETGAAWSKDLKVVAPPAPVQAQYIINYGNPGYAYAQVGKIGNLTDEMEYYLIPQTGKPSASSANWRAVDAGQTLSGGLTQPGNYWVRYKGDENNSNWRSVTIQEYFTVTAEPADSVSKSRIVFTESPAYTTLEDGRVWLVPAGSKINVTATSSNTKYYKITRITLENLDTEAWTYKNINSQNSASTGSFTVNAPYYVTASAGVYGSKTGDYSHLDLWMELAALSLMGLCAAVVIGRKKLRKQ